MSSLLNPVPSSSASGSAGEYGAQHTDYVLVPSSKCGLIIGKGGATIKQVSIPIPN